MITVLQSAILTISLPNSIKNLGNSSTKPVQIDQIARIHGATKTFSPYSEDMGYLFC